MKVLSHAESSNGDVRCLPAELVIDHRFQRKTGQYTVQPLFILITNRKSLLIGTAGDNPERCLLFSAARSH